MPCFVYVWLTFWPEAGGLLLSPKFHRYKTIASFGSVDADASKLTA
jgi:hypothetical protein